jgi:thiamine-phosphate pyrophosphorylase
MSKTRLAECRLYGFIDTAYIEGLDPGDVARDLIAGGVDIIQVRAKEKSHADRVELGRTVVSAAFQYKVPVIINDDIEAAFEAGADGVHLGQEDWAAISQGERARRLADMRIIGISTHSIEQALAAERDGANYIGVGPVFATATKPGVKPVGVELVREVAARVKTPFFAIGGITLDNIGEVLEAGATRVAVVSAILKTSDRTKAAASFRKRLDKLQPQRKSI